MGGCVGRCVGVCYVMDRHTCLYLFSVYLFISVLLSRYGNLRVIFILGFEQIEVQIIHLLHTLLRKFIGK